MKKLGFGCMRLPAGICPRSWYCWNIALSKPQARDCVQCGQCESQCPQHLPIIELLKDCVKNLEA